MEKFVVIEDSKTKNLELRMANTDFHENMVPKGDRCLGGGLFKIEEETKTVLLWGKSEDFGKVDFSKLKKISTYEDLDGYKFILRENPTSPKDTDITKKLVFDLWC